MKNENVINRLDYLEIKIRELIEAHLTLKNKYKLAQDEISSLKFALKEHEEEGKNFQNQDNFSNIVNSLAENTPSNAELKMKINEVINEIDRCIAHLSE